MSIENSVEPGVYRNASTDANEVGAWVSGALLDEGEPIKYLASKKRLLYRLTDIPIFHQLYEPSNDGYQTFVRQEESVDGSCDLRFKSSYDSGYVSLNSSPELALRDPNEQYQMHVSAEQPASEEEPASGEEPASDNSHLSGRSFTNPPRQDHDSRFSSRASSKNESDEDSAIPSPEDEVWLILAYARHRMMVSLMRDVYAIFNSQWAVGLQNRAGSEQANTGTNSQGSSSSTPSADSRDTGSSPSSAQSGNKRIHDRDSDPPDDNIDKKRKINPANSGMPDQTRLFACCFHKYNAQKYCSNSETGTKYRSCAGPGFSKISQLKQHLRRNHRAPIYCPRCWVVMESQAEMALHANAQQRCEQKEPQVQEGVDHDKMRMITDTRGVSWKGIYEILFPGAPIPSPYYEEDDLSLETREPSSPRSQELRDFDIYNRTNLPLLVEENLRALLNPQLAPIEEHVRALVVDVVRTCQSTIARNFQLTAASASLADRTQSSHQTITSAENAGQTDEEPTQTLRNGTAGLDFFHEPPHVNTEASTLLPGPMLNHGSATGSQNPNSDSGYSSLPFPCSCSCHEYLKPLNMVDGRSSCQSCDHNHIDYNDLINDPFNDWNVFDSGNF